MREQEKGKKAHPERKKPEPVEGFLGSNAQTPRRLKREKKERKNHQVDNGDGRGSGLGARAEVGRYCP